MRFYILSDLHLRSEVESLKTSERIKKLCSKIRKSTKIGENILFIILGDIADKGKALSFDTARNNLSMIIKELEEYTVNFEFVPGNHDLDQESLELFNQLTLAFGSTHSYEDDSVHSAVHEGVNFIFADSTLSRNHAAAGSLDIDRINENVKPNMANIIFCHHALSHGHGSPHDTIEDSAGVIKKLNSMGISFFFHGHVHDAKITIPVKGLVEIGCGSLSGGISWLPSVFHQFLVGYIQDNKIVRIERWIDTEDGHGDFALSELYPKPKEFSDPDDIGKISYDPVEQYISRVVSLYEDSNQSSLAQLMMPEKSIPLKDALARHQMVLLLCDAGMGKSVELMNLAYEMSDRFHTYLYSLENYEGQAIEEILPEAYKALAPSRIVLLLDGYDELDNELAKKFRNKLKAYTQDSIGVNIVISSRSNFCGNEDSNKSRTFQGFYVYVLEKLSKDDIRIHLKSNGIDDIQFWNCAHARGVRNLVYTPFYLFRLSEIYAKEKDLPPKSELMDKLIAETFEVDDIKFSGDLEDRYFEMFSLLERLAIAMQLMHRQSFEDRKEYQDLFSLTDRELIKKSGLLKREGTIWKFLHNNFREYLAARYLKKIPQKCVISILYDGANIKPYWVNTLGFLTGFELDWNLNDWLIENAPSALVKFESDKLEPEIRYTVFKRIFDKYELLHLYINDELFDVVELAHFVASNEALNFLLDRISCPEHSISQYNAINILRCYPYLFGKEKQVREVLLNCCEQYPTTDKTTCRLAMVALSQLKLHTPDVIERLMKKFTGIDEDYIRLGMYEYLLGTEEYNSHVHYCLSGIRFISYRLNESENRIANESYELKNCLKHMSTVESVTAIVKWFSQKKHSYFYDAKEVIQAAIESAIDLYKSGYVEIYDTILESYLKSSNEWNTTVSNAMVKFFIDTGTQYSAATVAAAKFEERPQHMSDLVYSDLSIIEHLKNAYVNEKTISKHAFKEIVLWYVRDEDKYIEYADLIRKTDRIELPAYKRTIDYDALNTKANREYFEILFDEEKRKALTVQLIEKVGDPNLKGEELLRTGIKVESHSVLWRLQTAMYHYGADIRISEFFDQIDMDRFIIWSLSRLLSDKFTVIPTQTQKEKLMEIVESALKNDGFKDSVTYYPNGHSVDTFAEELLSVILYLDYTLEEKELLDLTELPAYIFSKNNESDKYAYLTSKCPIEKIKKRLILNLETNQVNDMVLNDHIEFFNECRDSSIAEFAYEICRNQSESYLRSSAWRYLYNTLGAEYIAEEILPIADAELLMEINGACKDISRMKLRVAMEYKYKECESIQLQAHLITFGSRIAIMDYVEKVISDKCPPEGIGTHIDGPTVAISTINDPEFLFQLECLLEVVFDPSFRDCSWRSLRNSLSRAFVNCGIREYKKTLDILVKHRPAVDVNERNYRYCNYIMEEIGHNRKTVLDAPMTLAETKKILAEAKMY